VVVGRVLDSRGMSEMTDEQLAWIEARADSELLTEERRLAPESVGKADEFRIHGTELAQLMRDRDDLLAEVKRLRET